MHRPPPIPRVSPRWVFAATCCLLAGLVRIAAADDTTAVVTIVDDMPAAGRLAAPATGQTLYIIDEARRAVAAVDPFDPTKRWIAIGSDVLDGAGLEEPTRPVAIGCIDSNTLALVCRMGAAWSVRIYNRLAAPGSTTPSAALLQTLPLGASTQDAPAVDLVVSPSRDWLTIIGLPPPLPPIVRAPIAGARSEPVSERRCPRLPAGRRPLAATISLGEEWVLFTPEPAAAATRVFLSFFSNFGTQRLLHLDTGLAGVRDAACCRGSGTLWVVASDADATPRSSGLWRIDAVLEKGRQAARPVCVAKLENPLSLVCLSDRAIAVTVGQNGRQVVRVNPLAASGDDGLAAP
jgi:hypothetical protein